MYVDENGNMVLWSDVINCLNGTLLKTNTSKEEKYEDK